jgi:hypothetical protein
MSGLETKELEELEQKDAPETVNTVTTSGTKRKRTRRPKLIWVMGEKMRADDPRRDAPFMDDEDITDDIQDWEPAESLLRFKTSPTFSSVVPLAVR